MTFHRENTAVHKRWRKMVLHNARIRGIHNCPVCGVALDYRLSRRPNSAEADHILPLRRGGGYTLENGQVLCRRCNQSKGARVVPLKKRPAAPRAVVHNEIDIYDW